MRRKTDEEILAEAKAALEPALRIHAEAFAHDVRNKLRKEFPFGPDASRREKEIWHDAVKETISSLKTWAQGLVIVMCLLFFFAIPAGAADNNELQEVQIVDQHGEPFAVAAPATYETPVKQKKLWSEKHPKLHKLKRRFVRFCKQADPVARFAGSVAQIFMAICGN